MPYYCKNCGAVVTGKFCSCCGAMVRSDLRDFRLELSKRKRSFSNRFYENGYLPRFRMANTAWELTENLLFGGLNESNFNEKIEWAYSMIPFLEDSADRLCREFIDDYETIAGRWAKRPVGMKNT